MCKEDDRLLHDIIRQIGRLTYKVHGHTNAGVRVLRYEHCLLFSCYAKGVIEQGNKVGGITGVDDSSDGRLEGVCNEIANSAANFPGLAFGPRSFIVDSAVKKALEVCKSAKRQFRRDWHDH